MRGLDILKQVNNSGVGSVSTSGDSTSTLFRLNDIDSSTKGQGFSSPDLTVNPAMMDDSKALQGNDWINSFMNAIDEIDKSNYSGKRKPYELKIKQAERDVIEIENQIKTGELSVEEGEFRIKQKQLEIQREMNDPEYRKLTEKIRQQEIDIEDSPVSKRYAALQHIFETEENTDVYNFLKHELPKELGGSASEIGTQLATTYGPKLVNSLVKKAAVSATGGPLAPWIMAGLTTAEIATGMYGLWKMRDAESDAEVNDAYEQKVSQDIAAKTSQLGRELTQEEKLDIEIAAHKGLEDVKAQNMNLMLSDAMEILLLATPWKGLSSLVKGSGKLNSTIAKVGNAISSIEDIGRATRFGRLGTNAASFGLTALSEGMEEADQYSIKSQYLAGKYADNNGFLDNLGESLGHRKDSADYMLTGESGEGYEEDADYRNAVRSGAILGGLMGGAGTAAKIYSDERNFKKTAAEVKSLTPQMLEAERDVYRSKLYTKYFASGRENFLMEALQNLATNNTNPEHAKAAAEELVKAKEGLDIFKRVQNTHNNLADEDIAKVYSQAQRLTDRLEDADRSVHKINEEYVNELKGIATTVGDAVQTEALKKLAYLEAARRNLDIYNTLEDKPSNIIEHEKALEDKYRKGLEDYKEFLNLHSLDNREFVKKQNILEKLVEAQRKNFNVELSKNTLRNNLVNLFTKEGVKNFLNEKPAKKTEVKKDFDITKASVEEYLEYEKKNESKARLNFRRNKIDRELFDKNILARLKNEDIDDILEDINNNTPKITKGSFLNINMKALAKKSDIIAKQRRKKFLVEKEEESLFDDTIVFTPEEAKELSYLNSIDNSRFERAYESFLNKKDDYALEIPEASDTQIKRNIKETFIKGASAVRDHFTKNSDYMKLGEVKNELSKLKALKKIFKGRDEELRTSKEFAGFEDKIDENIAALEAIAAKVEKRLADRDARDRRIPANQTKLILNQLGLKEDGTVIESKKAINDIIIDLVGKEAYDAVIADANGNLQRIHGDIFIQLIRDSKKDKSALLDAIEEAKDAAFDELFAVDRINSIMPANGSHVYGSLVNTYYANPVSSFKEMIRAISDNENENSYDNQKSSSVYKFTQDKDVVEFIHNLNEEDRATSKLTKEELSKIIELHLNYAALFELTDNINSETNLEVQLSRELELERDFAKADKRKTPTPSNQQLTSIKELYRFLKAPFKGTNRFDGFAYLQGAAGTGKTNVVMRWVFKLSGLKKESLYTIGHNEHSAKTIADSLGKEGEVNTIQKAIAELDTLSEDVKLIVLDEAPGVSQDDITEFADTIAEVNKKRKNKLRVIMLGDPNQIVKNGYYSPLDSTNNIDGLERVNYITPLTIRYRTDVAPIVDVQDLFIDQDKDLTTTPIYTKANTDAPSSFSSSLLGVGGSKNFDTDVIAILKSRKDDGRTRAIIVNDAQDVAKYTQMLADNDITGVEVMTYVDSQGRTIDEVYVNIKYNKSFPKMKAYNTAMYTATSRATKYLFIGSIPVETEVSPTIEEITADRSKQNEERSEKFIKEHNAELDVVDKLVQESPKDSDLETEVTEEEFEEDIEDDTIEEEIEEVISNEDYNNFIDKNIVSKTVLSNITNKIINNESLSPRETAIFASKTSEINELIREYEKLNNTSNERNLEEDIEDDAEVIEEDDDSTVILEDEVLTADEKDLSDMEENSSVRHDFEDVPENVHNLEYPRGASVAVRRKDGTRGNGAQEGDEVHYLLREKNGKKQVVLVVPLGGNKYQEIGVLSSNELLNPPAGFESAYKELLDKVNAPDAIFEDFKYGDNGTYTIEDAEPLLKAKVSHAQKLTYVYNNTPKALSIPSIVEKFLASFFPLGNLMNRNAVKGTVRVFTHKETEEFKNPSKRPYELPFTPVAGIPYLVIEGLQQNGKDAQESKVQLIRLSPAKLNAKKHSKLIKPIMDFMNKVRETEAVLNSISGAENIKLGTEEFAQLVRAKSGYRIKLVTKLGINIAEYKTKEKELKKLFGQLDHIVYEHKEEYIKTGTEKNIERGHSVSFDAEEGTEANKFDGVAKVRKIEDKIAILSNGKKVPVKELYRVPAMKRFNGPAQKAFDEIAKSNIRGGNEGELIPLRTYFTDTKDNRTRTKGRHLLSEDTGSFSLEELENIFAFDETTGESTTNKGFGLRVPISRNDFKADGIASDIKVEDYLLDTFEEVLPSSISVSLNTSAKKEREYVVEDDTTSIPDVTEDLNDDYGIYLRQEEAAAEDLGKAVSPVSAFELVKKILPNISKEEVQIVSDAQMLAITKGVKAWGFFKQGIIYLLEGAGNTIREKVLRHEAFHKVFNENLTAAERKKAIAVARRDYPHLRGMNTIQVEEFLARKFQDWRAKQGKISLALVNIFKKILHVLGLYQTNFNNIESIMADIDNGILGSKKGEILISDRAMLKIREDYLSTKHYRLARHEVVTNLSRLLNAAIATKEGLQKIELKADASNLDEALPMEFGQALNEFEKLVESKLAAFKANQNNDKLTPEQQRINNLKVEVFTILNNEKTRKELIKSIYPNLYTSKGEFTDSLADTQQEIQEVLEAVSVYEDAVEADKINHERKIMGSVKDVLGTITYMQGNTMKIVNPRFAFVKLLEAFRNTDTTNLENLVYQIREGLGSSTPAVQAIAKRMEDLILDSQKKVFKDGDGKRKPMNDTIEFVNIQRFSYYDNTGTYRTINRGNLTTAAFIKDIQNKLEKAGTTVTLHELKAHYDKAKARDTIAAIRTSIGSLRKKNVMVAVRVSEVREDGKSLRVTHYRYNSIREQGTKQTVRNNIENAMINNYSNIDSKFIAKVMRVKTDTEREELIREFLDMLALPSDITIPEESLVKVFNDMKGFVETIPNLNENFDIDKLVEESNNRLESLSELLVKGDENHKAISYTAGDGTKRQEWTLASFAVDVFQYLAGSKKRKKENAKNFEFLTSELFKHNIFLLDETDKASNKLHMYVDHDSIKDKDGKYPSIPYSNETQEEWFSRTINYAFNAMLESRKEDSKGKQKYTQFVYTISNKPQIAGAEVDLKNDEEIRAIIAKALEQEANRPDLAIKSYNKDKSFLGAETVDGVYKYLEKIAEDLTQRLIDDKYVPSYSLANIQQTLASYMSPKFLEGKSLKENHAVNAMVRVKKDEQYPLTKEQLLPLIDLFVKNHYLNGHFLNQLVMGDQAFYKSQADQIKRMSISFAMGSTGMVNNNGWMKEKFHVAVVKDNELKIGEKFKRFKKFYGIKFEVTDGGGFMLPERFDEVSRGFSPEMGLGATMKPVYFGIDKDGIPRAMKYSTIVLTDELCKNFPELNDLREDMRNAKDAEGKIRPVGEVTFVSGFKVGAPTEENLTTHNPNNLSERGWTDADGNWNKGINPASVVELDNKNWRIQLNPYHNVNDLGETPVSNPTQLTYFSNLNGNNKVLAEKLYRLNAKLIAKGIEKLNRKLGEAAGSESKIRKVVADSLGDTEARLHEFITAKDVNGKHMISINFPVAVNKMVTQLGSTISKATVKIKYPGSKLVLQPDYNTTFIDKKTGKRRSLEFRDAEHGGYAEVIMPNLYKDQFKEGDILFESALGFRIPSTELHSAIPIKVVGFYDSKGTNVVIAPKEIMVAHGSDYDIDALFVMRRAAYKGEDVEGLLYNGITIGYNKDGNEIEDFSDKLEARIQELNREINGIKSKDKRKTLKKTKSKLEKAVEAGIKNEVVDTFLKIITDIKNEEAMMTPISTARLDGEVDSVFAELKELGVEINNKIDLNNPIDQAKIHSDNFSGTALVGSVADNVRGFAYILQSFNPTLSQRTEYIMGLEGGMEMINEIAPKRLEIINTLGTDSEEGKAALNELQEKHIADIEERLGVKVDSPFLPDKSVIEIDDIKYDRLSRTEKGNTDGLIHLVSETLDALINAALDNVKLQILPVINMTNNTGKVYVAMLTMGIPLNTVVKYMLSPSIKNISTARSLKKAFYAERASLKGLIEEAYMKGENPISEEELTTLINDTKVTVAGLNELIKVPYGKLNKEQLLLQYKVLMDFGKASSLGSEIDRVSKATKVLKELPVTQEEVQDLLDTFRKLKETKSAILKGVDIMKLPHIDAAYQALTKLNLVINTNFYKHREEINKVAKAIRNGLGIKFDYNDNKNLRMIRDEITKALLAGISYTVDGKIYDFDTSKEEPYSYKGYRNEDRDAVGTDAWNQRFIDTVAQAKTDNPRNKFLQGISISKEFGTGMNRLVFNGATNLEPDEIIDLQDAFKELINNGKYTDFQRDFVKYAVLNYGLSFGSSNYTLLLPVELYKELSYAMDNTFNKLLNERDTETTKRRLDNITQFIAIQMGVNYIDNLTQNNNYEKNGKYPKYGIDETPTGNVRYDLKFAISEQGVIDDDTEIGDDTELETEVQNTEGLESSDVTVVSDNKKKLKLPLMVRVYDKAYVQLPQNEGDSYIYYQEVSKKKYSKYYYFDKNLLFTGYGISDVFRRDSLVRNVPYPIDFKKGEPLKEYTTNITENSTIFNEGEYLSLKGYSDIARVNMFDYRISGVTFTNNEGEVVDREKATKVTYMLTNPQKVLILDESKLTEEDKKDLHNLC